MSMGVIGFIGATGMLGRPVAQALIQSGFRVRAICRDLERARPLLPTQVELVRGDLRDIASLKAALVGCTGLYLNLQVEQTSAESDWCAEREGLAAALAAAKAQGVGKVGYLSSLVKDDSESDWWVYRVKRQAAQAVRESGIPFTIFCPSCFMENLNHLQIKGDKLMNFSGGMTKNHWISGRDYGRMVAASFASPAAHNKEYWVQGLQALTLDQAAQQFVANYKAADLKVQSAPLGLMRFVALFAGRRMRFMTNVMKTVMNMPEPFKGQAAWDELAKPQDTVATYANSLT